LLKNSKYSSAGTFLYGIAQPTVTLLPDVTSPQVTPATPGYLAIKVPGTRAQDNEPAPPDNKNGSRQVPSNHDHVIDRFPELRKQVLELSLSDRDFAETCADYNEVCDVLQKMEAEPRRDASTAIELRRLRDDLEADLVEALATYDQERP
jgi:hypothetical protein